MRVKSEVKKSRKFFTKNHPKSHLQRCEAPYYYLNSLTRPAQTVTVSSEGPAAEMYPDSMGQYDILREVYRYDRPVYKHVDREDRFIIFVGKINV